MGKKERLQKELDLLLEKIRFWRYTLLALISAIVGMLFSITQGKVVVNYAILIFMVAGFLAMLIAVKRLSFIDKDYRELLKELERTE